MKRKTLIIAIILSIFATMAVADIVSPLIVSAPENKVQEYDLNTGYLATQSILTTGIPNWVSSIFTDNAASPWLARHTMGVPHFVWLSLIVVAWFMSGKPVPKEISFKEIKEENKWLTQLNQLFAYAFLASTLLWLYLWHVDVATREQTLFYMLLSLLSMGSLAVVLGVNAVVGMMAVSDRILNNVDVPENFQQKLLLLGLIGIFLLPPLLNQMVTPPGQAQAYNVAYEVAFAIEDDAGLRAENVAFSENRALIMLPTLLFMALFVVLGCVISESKINILEVSKKDSRKAIAILLISAIWTATIVGFVGSAFHEDAYKNMAPFVAARTGLTEDQALDAMLVSVGNFWSVGSASYLATGSIIPADIYHIFINHKATS